MVSRSADKRCSLYDSLPVLESWYPEADKDRKHQNGSPTSIHSMPPVCSESLAVGPGSDGRRSVSFSVEPPSVRYIGSPDDDDDELEVFVEMRRKHGVRNRVKHFAKRLLHHKQPGSNKVYAL